MGRAPCCEKVGLNKGKWTAEEDQKLVSYIKANGEGSWRSLPKNSGLLRCGKSCRLRWINYLRDDLKRGNISPEEEDTIIKLQASLGNRWSLIATHLPCRTDNEIKNHWNSYLSRRIQSDNPPVRKKRGRKPKSTTAPKNEKPIKKRKKSPPKEGINTSNIKPQEQQQMVQVSTTTSTCCNTPESSGESSSVEKPAGSGGSSNEEERIDLYIGDLERLLLDDNPWDEVNWNLWPAEFREENDMMDFQPNNSLEYSNGRCDQLEGDENLERWLQSSDFFINDLF